MSEPGAVFGRYVILERLGTGGMGVVYKAHDPELDRRLALKLVRVDGHGSSEESDGPTRSLDARERLLREAQAMARVSHPNVIAVHDVGSLGDDVFVAMELVDGLNLTRWLDERARPWRQVLDVFLQAGRGLAAAHDAGLVHRDFKPDNVLVGRDGRVRVLDFGLARALDDGPEQPAGAPAPRQADLTVTGAVVGTPAFMAPEQHKGEPTDPRSDQFSYCVALYLGLAGIRPFPGYTAVEIAAAVVAGKLRDPPPGRVPRFVWRALRRGLQVAPEARWPSMEALLGDLTRDPRRLALPGLAILGGTALLAAGAITLGPRPPPPCLESPGLLAGVWDATRRAGVERAFTATAAPWAADAWRGTRAALDRYAGGLTKMRREACEATRVRREQSAEIMDLRVDCLDDRARQLGALVTVLASADRAVVERAVSAAQGLGGLEACADVRWLGDRAQLPSEPAARGRTQVMLERVAQVHALKLAGRFADGLALARTLEQPAADIGHRPTEARTLFALADLTSRTGDFAAAEKIFVRAARAALAGRDLVLAASAYSELGAVAGVELGREEAGLGYLDTASALLEGAGGEPELLARVNGVHGQVLNAAGKGKEALPFLEKALELYSRIRGPDDIDTANVLNDLGGVHRIMGRYSDALAYLERARAIREKALGAAHPFTATTIFNIGNAQFSMGRYAEAEESYGRSLAIREAALGPEHPRIAETLVSMAQAQDSRGRRAEALAGLGRALAINEKTLGEESIEGGRIHNTMGDVLRGMGKPDEALVEYEHALAIKVKILGPQHGGLAVTVYSMGETQLGMGARAEALKSFQRALELDTRALGPDNPDLAYDLTGIGAALVDLGKPHDALAPLERALVLRSAEDISPADLAETRFVLARALVDARRDRERALGLARQARAAVAAAEAKQDAVATIDAWLRKQGEAPR